MVLSFLMFIEFIGVTLGDGLNIDALTVFFYFMCLSVRGSLDTLI